MAREMSNSRSSMGFFSSNTPLLHSKSNGNLQQQIQQLAARRHAVQMANLAAPRAILVTPLQMRQLGLNVTVQPTAAQVPLVNTPTTPTAVNVSSQTLSLHFFYLLIILSLPNQSAPRVKFALDTNQGNAANPNSNTLKVSGNSLQRSKSLSSADTLARGIAGLGLGLSGDANDIGNFKPEIQAIVDQALRDPNQLNARALMELANQIMQRAVEGRR